MITDMYFWTKLKFKSILTLTLLIDAKKVTLFKILHPKMIKL